MSMTLYHNPRCSKSRQALSLLQERGVEPDVMRYLENPLTADAIQTLQPQPDMGPRELSRTGEKIDKELNVREEGSSEQALINAIAEHPTLTERPLMVSSNRAVIGRPPDRVL